MTLNEIETALGQHLEGMTNCPPIAWGNKTPPWDMPGASGPKPKPHLRTLHQPVTRIDPTPDGSIPEDKTGIWLVTVVAESDMFTTEANTIAEAVAQRFRAGTRLDAGSGNVLIDRGEPVPGFHDDANNWVAPVRINYQTEG